MPEEISTRVWLITGASSGFGRHLVNLLLARDDYVIATARSLDKISDFPPSNRLRLLQLDVNTGPQVIKIKIEEAISFWGRIDVLVNNAGFSIKALLEEGGSEQCMEQFRTNVFGLIDVTTAVLPHMRNRRSGTIIMMGSRQSWKADIPSSGFYAASKGAVHAYSETLAAELRDFSIRILIVEPGAFRTEGILSSSFFLENQIPDYDRLRKKTTAMYEEIVLKGDPAKAMEVVIKVVKGEGNAQGRPWPLYLILGDVAETSVRDKCDEVLKVIDEWKDMTQGLDLDE